MCVGITVRFSGIIKSDDRWEGAYKRYVTEQMEEASAVLGEKDKSEGACSSAG